MGLRFYNTRTRRLEEFAPAHPPRVAMYVCGPTVYDEPHIGHARSAYVFDVIRRWLAYRGHQVDFVRNVTDVDDKIIQRAQQEGRPAEQVAAGYLASYHAALEQLGIAPPTQEPRATQYIDQMTDLIAKLLVNGIAYEAKGSVYFSVSKFPAYGRLSNRSTEDMLAGTRGEPEEGKRDPLDFALWKAAKSGEPSWPAPWGAGRPGWHVECSAMSMHCLGGPQIDIHGGGLDLIFPHHENEIAQSETATGQSPFANFWLHHGLLTINGQKMSKSLGNFVTVDKALIACGGEPDALKMFFLGAHYRSPIDYSAQSQKAALGRYQRTVHFCHRVANTDVLAEPHDLPVPSALLTLQEEFLNAMDDDLNTPKALAALDALVTMGYATPDPLQRHAVSNTIFQLGKLLGLFGGFVGIRLSHEQHQLLQQREEARRRRDFITADRIRKTFATEGLALEDTPEGVVVLPKS